MTIPSSLPLTGYQRAARSLGAKSAGAAALSVVAAVGLASNAQAAIVGGSFTGTTTGQYFGTKASTFGHFDTGVATPTFVGAQFGVTSSSSEYDDGFSSSILGQYGAKIAGENILVTKFSKNAVIGSGTPFTASADLNAYFAGGAAQWSGVTGYFGIKFSLVDGAHYGWVKLQTNADASVWTISDFAYNDAVGESILAGQGPTPVPEPATSAALLALGAAGLVAYRRRKNLQRAAA